MGADWPIFVMLLIVVGSCIAALPFRTVSRGRLERFARRYHLRITVDNGPMILRYLGTTSAWRWAGALLAGAGTTYDTWARGESIELHYAAVFAGWFAGAVIAEWRVERVAAIGSRRSAALVPRRIGDYLTLWVICLPVAMYGVVLAIELVALVRASGHRVALGGWLLVTLISAAAVITVGRRVLARPQPVTAPDVIAADEARRAASLHVLVGAAIAIGGYLVVGLAGVPARPVELWESWPPLAATLAAILLPALAAAAAMLSRPYTGRRVGTSP